MRRLILLFLKPFGKAISPEADAISGRDSMDEVVI